MIKEKQKRKKYLILLSIVGLGAFLRLFNLGAESYLYREVCAIDQALLPIHQLFFHDGSPPLYHLFLKGWIWIWGTGEYAPRSLSVLFGVLSIYLTYMLGRSLFSKKTGLIASLLVAVSPLHIYYSQYTRYYTLFLFLMMLQVLLMISVLKKPKRNTCFFVSVNNIFLLGANFFMAGIMIFLQNILFLLKYKSFAERKKWAFLQFLSLLPFAAWFLGMIPQFSSSYHQSIGVDYYLSHYSNNPTVLFRLLMEFICGHNNIYSSDLMSNTFFTFSCGFLFLIMMIFVFLGLAHKEEGKNRTSIFEGTFFAVLWLFFPMIALHIFGLFFYPLLVVRYLLLSSVLMVILAAKGISNLSTKKGRVILLACVVALSINLAQKHYLSLERSWEEIVGHVNSIEEERKLIIAAPSSDYLMFLAHYGENGWHEIKPFEPFGQQRKGDIREDAALYEGGHIYSQGKTRLVGLLNSEQAQKFVASKEYKALEKEVDVVVLILEVESDWMQIKQLFEKALNRESVSSYFKDGIFVYSYYL